MALIRSYRSLVSFNRPRCDIVHTDLLMKLSSGPAGIDSSSCISTNCRSLVDWSSSRHAKVDGMLISHSNLIKFSRLLIYNSTVWRLKDLYQGTIGASLSGSMASAKKEMRRPTIRKKTYWGTRLDPDFGIEIDQGLTLVRHSSVSSYAMKNNSCF